MVHSTDVAGGDFREAAVAKLDGEVLEGPTPISLSTLIRTTMFAAWVVLV